MTNAEILSNIKVGAVVINKQILSALYRKGMISSYSQWGYLEGEQVRYKVARFGYKSTDWDYIELFPKGNRDEVTDKLFESREDVFKAVGYGTEIEYMGCKFRTRYLSGCFKPYLELTEKMGDKEKAVNSTISLYGAII